jgi:hypothetical protein
MENEDRQSKTIMFHLPINFVKNPALKFRWCILRNPHVTAKYAAISPDLKGVTVNEVDGAVTGNKDTALIDIANNVAAVVDRLKCRCAVHRHMGEEFPICLRKSLFPLDGTVKLMNLCMSRNPRLNTSDKLATRDAMKSSGRPRSHFQYVRAGHACHYDQFFDLLCVDAFVVDFCDGPGI